MQRMRDKPPLTVVTQRTTEKVAKLLEMMEIDDEKSREMFKQMRNKLAEARHEHEEIQESMDVLDKGLKQFKSRTETIGKLIPEFGACIARFRAINKKDKAVWSRVTGRLESADKSLIHTLHGIKELQDKFNRLETRLSNDFKKYKQTQIPTPLASSSTTPRPKRALPSTQEEPPAKKRRIDSQRAKTSSKRTRPKSMGVLKKNYVSLF